MGIESYLVASTVNLIIAQRLLRKNCTHCAEARALTDAERNSLTEIIPADLVAKIKQVSIGKGCKECNGTGFSGRLSINEILLIDEEIREAILRRDSVGSLKKLAVERGMTPMLADGILKVIEGKTTIDEVLRVINE
jgi:type II secretory ATPase GspE/PulE/Tfp pilus assembly ATPase PilB-like protein